MIHIHFRMTHTTHTHTTLMVHITHAHITLMIHIHLRMTHTTHTHTTHRNHFLWNQDLLATVMATVLKKAMALGRIKMQKLMVTASTEMETKEILRKKASMQKQGSRMMSSMFCLQHHLRKILAHDVQCLQAIRNAYLSRFTS